MGGAHQTGLRVGPDLLSQVWRGDEDLSRRSSERRRIIAFLERHQTEVIRLRQYRLRRDRSRGFSGTADCGRRLPPGPHPRRRSRLRAEAQDEGNLWSGGAARQAGHPLDGELHPRRAGAPSVSRRLAGTILPRFTSNCHTRPGTFRSRWKSKCLSVILADDDPREFLPHPGMEIAQFINGGYVAVTDGGGEIGFRFGHNFRLRQ